MTVATLTPGERRVLRLWLSGWTRKEIASFLRVTVKAVDRHMVQLRLRTGAGHPARLVLWALARGIYPEKAMVRNDLSENFSHVPMFRPIH